MEEMRGAGFAGSAPPFRGRERAAVDVDVGPERRSPRYHETCLALESVEESSAAVSKPRGVWLRMPTKSIPVLAIVAWYKIHKDQQNIRPELMLELMQNIRPELMPTIGCAVANWAASSRVVRERAGYE